jgi:hypothetical protein
MKNPFNPQAKPHKVVRVAGRRIQWAFPVTKGGLTVTVERRKGDNHYQSTHHKPAERITSQLFGIVIHTVGPN